MSLTSLQKAIIATLAYSALKEWSLSSWEIYRYLINPRRLGNRHEQGQISFIDIQRNLSVLQDKGLVVENNGFYILAKHSKKEWGNKRILQEKNNEQRIKKALKKIALLKAFPFIRGVFLSGSLVFGWSCRESDIDLLIVAQKNRLWTLRFLLSSYLYLIGVKRTKKIKQGKICLNHFISEAQLHIPLYSLYNANTYVRLKPVLASKALLKNFITANQWLSDYLYFSCGRYYLDQRCLKSGYLTIALKKIVETFFNLIFLGRQGEKMLKRFQVARIKKSSGKTQEQGRIVVEDDNIELHPASPERIITEQYNQFLEDLGIFDFCRERDSGLS